MVERFCLVVLVGWLFVCFCILFCIINLVLVVVYVDDVDWLGVCFVFVLVGLGDRK